MSLFNKIMFSIFEKNDKKSKSNDSNIEKKENDLSQPTPPTDSEKKNINKKLLIKILIWVSIILVIGLIIGLSVFLSQDTSKDVGKYDTSVTENKIQFTSKNKNEVITIDTTKNDNLISSTYYQNSSKWIVHAKGISNNIEIVVRFIVNSNGNNSNANDIYFSMWVNSFNYVLINSKIPSQTINMTNSAQWLMNTNNFATNPKSFDWLALFSMLIPIVFIVVIIYYYSRMLKGGAGGNSLFGQKDNTFSKVSGIKARFDDVAGIDEVKNELKEVVDYLKRPQKYTAMGARIPRGLILYGPPGTGKTLIAKAVAGEANVPFYQANGASFDDMFVGSGARRIRDLFQKASKEAPSIIFIDEIDAVAGKRGSNSMMGSGGIADQTINELLSQMDGFTSKENVIVIAATNRIDTLDPAILRPGRFDLQIQVVLPDIDGRESILKIHSRNKNLSSDVNLRDIARRTAGFSGAQLEDVLNEATLLAVRENKTAINVKNIDEAIDRVIGGPKRENRVISNEEKMQIAYHEAGHALVGLNNNAGEVVEKITIIPRGQAAGYTMQTPQDQERMIPRKRDMIALIQMALGGRASEDYIFGNENVSAGASNDLYKVTNIARAIVGSYGMSSVGLTQYIQTEGQTNQFKNNYSESIANKIDDEVSKIINENYDYAINVIKNNKKELELIVVTLLVLETIVKSQIDYIHKNKELPLEVLERKKELDEAWELISTAPINKK